MGNYHKFGLIYNKSNENIFFVVHKEATHPFNQVIEEAQKKQLKIEQVEKLIYSDVVGFMVPSKKFITAGLDELSYNGKQYISIIRGSGNVILKGAKISSPQDVRIKIREDFSVSNLSQQFSERLKNIAQGKKIEFGKCYLCNQFSEKVEVKDVTRCDRCKQAIKTVWACKQQPFAHTFCQRCHQAGLVEDVLRQMKMMH